MSVLLSVRDLQVSYATARGRLIAVDGAELSVAPGQIVAVVGESGSGKSTLARALAGLLPESATVTGGSARFDGEELVGLPERRFRALRGLRIGMIPQDPMLALNPVARVGRQVAETLRIHHLASAREARRAAVDLLDAVGLPDPAARARQYPHELSGGMRQRVLIAAALAARPQLVIADEPTSALDVSVQRHVLDHLGGLAARFGTAVVLITHDLALAGERADDLVVLYSGRTVEAGPATALLELPHHPYTAALAASTPSLIDPRHRLVEIPGAPPDPDERATGCGFVERCGYATAWCATRRPALSAAGADRLSACWFGPTHPQRRQERVAAAGSTARTVAHRPQPAADAEPMLRVERVGKVFRVRGQRGQRAVLRAVDDVSLTVGRGESLGIVGESGSGKSTLARLVLHLISPSSGRVVVDGTDLSRADGRTLRRLRQRIQPIFQDPQASFDPRFTVRDCVEEPLRAFGVADPAGRRRRVDELLDAVALPRRVLSRRPAELSGGQQQRVAIARALAPRPDLLVCDEPVSSLDASVQAQILNLLSDLRGEYGLSYLFISHDLAVVRHIASRVCVMRSGRVVESGPVESVFADPVHDYTRQLVRATPRLARSTNGANGRVDPAAD